MAKTILNPTQDPALSSASVPASKSLHCPASMSLPAHAASGGLVSRRSIMNMLVKSSAAVGIAAVSPIVASQKVNAEAAADPIVALAERTMQAWNDLSAACAHVTPFEEAMIEWRKNNPQPQLRAYQVNPKQAFHVATGRFFDIDGGPEAFVDFAPGADMNAALKEQKIAMGRWKRRKQAAGRRTGFAQARKTQDAASDRASELIEQLCAAQPRTLAGLAAKARAARLIDEGDLECSMAQDIGIMVGEIDESVPSQHAP
jgi:hypothetical protein